MCTYNGAKYIDAQLKTILNQTYPIYELIISDDGSWDNTVEIVEKYQKAHPIIKLFKNEVNQGVNNNFLTALKKAKGDFIAISDQDDIWELNKLENQIHCIGDNLLCFHLSEPFSEDGVSVNFDKRIPNYNIVRMIHFNMIPGHTMLFKKELLELRLDTQTFLYDAQLALVAGIYGKIVYVNKILVHHRRYINAYSYSSPINYERTVKNMIIFLLSSFKLFFEKRKVVKKHFEFMYSFLSPYQKSTGLSHEYAFALKLCLTLSKQNLISVIKAIFLCIKFRDLIFYSKENNICVKFIRATFHPLFLYKYFK